MELDYPYQLVAFLDEEPAINEPVYGGSKGWYPQIALKRRFKIEGMSEQQMAAQIQAFCSSAKPLNIRVGSLVKTDRMPVQVLEVEYTPELRAFHTSFIAQFGDKLISRYPDRDGQHYYPHITAEYDGKMVIEPDMYAHKTFTIRKVCLLKDATDEDSHAYRYFELG